MMERGYEVHGLVSRVALEDPDRRFGRIRHLEGRLTLHSGSLESYPSIFQIFSQVDFDECYHLAAQSFVAESFADPDAAWWANVDGTRALRSVWRICHDACRSRSTVSSK
jgi:GDPmannose 4,6-dehydratase